VIAINHTGDTGVMLHESRHAYHYLTGRIIYEEGKFRPLSSRLAFDNEIGGYRIQYAYAGRNSLPSSQAGNARYINQINDKWLAYAHRNGNWLYPGLRDIYFRTR
jgi:hypothetical protein